MTVKIALMYDFDETLSTKNMQEYSLLPALGLDAATFWGNVTQLAKTADMDPTLAYMYEMIHQAKIKGVDITRESFRKQGAFIEYYPGVVEFFAQINAYGQSKGAKIEHYIISSGNKEIIEGCQIYDEFTRVFASSFHYDENGNADWPAVAINYTGKTQFLYRINKNALEIYDSSRVNSKIAPNERDIPFNRMIYLGDGMTDVPCMSLVKEHGGYSIGVYTNEHKATVKKLIADERVNFACKADYRPQSSLYQCLCTIIDKIVVEASLSDFTDRL